MILHIDADSLVYASAFAVQRKNEPIEPLKNALYVLKKQLNYILEEFEDAEYTLYITAAADTTNFRNEIATFKKYKGNRDKMEKPVYYTDCRKYLIDKWGAQVVYGEEADDRVAIEHMKIYNENPDNTTIVAIDKDLDNIPGRHYNYQKKLHYEVSAQDAKYNFYKQLLVGDRADNVDGVPKIGEVTARKILAPYKYSEHKMFELVSDQYIRHYNTAALKRLLEHGQLLWIRQKEGEVWQFPEEIH